MDKFLIIAGILVAAATFIGLLVYLHFQHEKKRGEAMLTLANDLGLQFQPERFAQIESAVSNLRLFNQGHSKNFKNMLLGDTDEVDIAIFDYKYTVGHGKHAHTHQQSVMFFQSKELSLPKFELRPEGMFHKIGQAFGYQDIDFDTHPAFSKAFLLRGEDEVSIRQLFRPHVLDFFEGQTKISLEGDGDRFVFFRQGKRLKPDEIRGLMTEGFRVHKVLRS